MRWRPNTLVKAEFKLLFRNRSVTFYWILTGSKFQALGPDIAKSYCLSVGFLLLQFRD